MDIWDGGGEGGITLLRYTPCSPQPPRGLNARTKDRFLSKLRRRSRSAPRTREPKPITYSANGEKLKTSEKPGRVELVGFTTCSNLTPGSQENREFNSEETLTSAEIKEKRRLKLTDMNGRCGEADPGPHPRIENGFNHKPLSSSDNRLGSREMYLAHQRSLLEQGNLKNNDVFSQFLREREERMRRLTGGLLLKQTAFLPSTNPASQLIDLRSRYNPEQSRTNPIQETGTNPLLQETTANPLQDTDSEHSSQYQNQEREKCDKSDKNCEGLQEEFRSSRKERVIPIQFINEPMLPRLDSVQQGGVEKTTLLHPDLSPILSSVPSLFSDLKLDSRSSLEHARFASNFGFGKFGDDISAFRNGIRESFFGFQNFGKFPSFGPLLPGDSLNLSPHTRRQGLREKKRLQKSKSTSDPPKNSFRYVNDGGVEFPSSETESEDDLDSVSVVARTRDRLSGTGSTQSEDSSTHSGESSIHSHSTVSQDSGISETEDSRTRTKPSRPISAVPSELSDVSVLSGVSQGSDENPCDRSSVSGSGEAKRCSEPSSEDIEKKKAKVYNIAKELLSTEIRYVANLHLIDQVFHFRVDQENRSSNLFPGETIPAIFSNIKSIYKFHAEFLLPQLKERMELWPSSPEYQRIGDIMIKYSPFLIMYTEYVRSFDTSMRTINHLYNKNSKFAALMDDIHAMEECENLSLQHHMLSPVQRIPRYQLLLADYLNNLPFNSPDRADAEGALRQVSQAAAHANDSMKRIEQFKKLLEVQESTGGSIDLVSPTRELIREGRIVKISARTGDHQERYLFLLTDLLLLCSNRKSMISGSQYGVRAKFMVENLQVSEGDNLVTANTFYLRDETKSVELYTTTREEKDEWIQALYFAIKSLYTRKSSLRVGREVLRPLDCELGKRKPHLQKLETALKCAECSAQFGILKHKHNCRTCGAVFCSKCTDYRYPLSWEEGRKGRICTSCHVLLSNQLNPGPPSRPRGLLEVPANSPSIYAGWLVLRSPGIKSSSSSKRFFVLLPDFVLYSYRGEQDSSALTATPLPGFSVGWGADLRGDGYAPEKDRDRVIKLYHPSSNRVYYFAGNNTSDVRRWVEVLKLAVKAELPSPTTYNNPTPNLSSKQTIDVKKKSTVVTDLLRNDSCETILDVGDSCDNKSVSSTEYENS